MERVPGRQGREISRVRGWKVRPEEACGAWGQGVLGRLDKGSCGGEGGSSQGTEEFAMTALRGRYVVDGIAGHRAHRGLRSPGGLGLVCFFQDGRTLAFLDC